MTLMRHAVLLCFGMLLVLCALPLIVVAYAAYCEGGVRILFEAETTEAATKWGETDAQLRDRLEKDGWTLVAGMESHRLGTRFVRLTRYRLARYLPLSSFGVTPACP